MVDTINYPARRASQDGNRVFIRVKRRSTFKFSETCGDIAMDITILDVGAQRTSMAYKRKISTRRSVTCVHLCVYLLNCT